MRNKKAYRNKTDMESMSSPLCHQHGKHTWSLSSPKWQTYLIPPYTYSLQHILGNLLLLEHTLIIFLYANEPFQCIQC